MNVKRVILSIPASEPPAVVALGWIRTYRSSAKLACGPVGDCDVRQLSPKTHPDSSISCRLLRCSDFAINQRSRVLEVSYNV